MKFMYRYPKKGEVRPVPERYLQSLILYRLRIFKIDASELSRGLQATFNRSHDIVCNGKACDLPVIHD